MIDLNRWYTNLNLYKKRLNFVKLLKFNKCGVKFKFYSFNEEKKNMQAL
jgi:hypothetical protein